MFAPSELPIESVCENVESDGVLGFLELPDDLPFKPKRIFYVRDTPIGTVRGGHAHYKTQQYLVCLNGVLKVELFDGIRITTHLLRPGNSLLVKEMVWDTVAFLTGNDVLLAFCSTHFDPKDYIEDKDLFLRLLDDTVA